MTDLDIPAFLLIPATGRKAATPCKNESKSWALPAAATNRKTENITSSPRVFSSYIIFARILRDQGVGPVHGGTG